MVGRAESRRLCTDDLAKREGRFQSTLAVDAIGCMRVYADCRRHVWTHKGPARSYRISAGRLDEIGSCVRESARHVDSAVARLLLRARWVRHARHASHNHAIAK